MSVDLCPENVSGSRRSSSSTVRLEGANLEGTCLKGADLRGVDLSGVTGLTWQQIREAVIDGATRLPDFVDAADS